MFLSSFFNLNVYLKNSWKRELFKSTRELYTGLEGAVSKKKKQIELMKTDTAQYAEPGLEKCPTHRFLFSLYFSLSILIKYVIVNKKA